METHPTSLILTKLRAPAVRSRAILRIRLLQKMALGADTDLVLISAPAGYGKTTLLVEWTQQLKQTGISAAWYSLDESDNNPIVFGSYLVTGLLQLPGSDSGLDQILQTLRSSPEIDLMKILPAIVNAIFIKECEIVLVLDDYHLIQSPVIHQAVEFLITHRPDNFHLAIGSRVNPLLPLARWRARGRLIEFHTADLRFTEDETMQFLHETMCLDVPAELSNRLSNRVEGWAAGLQLAALSLPGQIDPSGLIASFTGGHKRLAEYLLEEVVNGLTESLQSFLLYSSILERMSAPVCDSILGIENSAVLLKQLEESNLFVTALDEEETWYRYHHLFRDFLLTWLIKTQPERASALHRSASRWFAEHGSLREASYHAFQCGDWLFAADFVEQYSFDLIIQSEIATIYEWCSAFPETVMQNRPKLCIFQGLALAYHVHAKNRSRVESRLQQAERKLAGSGNLEQTEELNELATVVRSFLAMIPDPRADAQELLNLAKVHLTGYQEGDPGRFAWLLISGYSLLALHRISEGKKAFEDALPLALRSNLLFGTVETTFHLACLARSKGRLADGLRICREGQETLTVLLKGTNLEFPALGCLDAAIGDILLEQGNLEEAEHHLRQGMDRMGWGMSPYILMVGWLAKFRLAQIQGKLNEALNCLDQLDLLWEDIQFFTRGLRAQVMLHFQGNDEAVQSAKKWLRSDLFADRDNLPLPGLGPIGAAEVFYQTHLVWARLQIEVGNPEVVLPYLEKQLDLAEEHELSGRVIDLTLLEAQVQYQLGNEETALALLQNTLTLGNSEGYLAVFDQSPVLDDLLHIAVKTGIDPVYCERILAFIRNNRRNLIAHPAEHTAQGAQVSGTSSAFDTRFDPLSDRELDVLRMMATGATNQAIADRLVITVGTVKSHINHILGKLNARNRTEAVAKARQLGLLNE
ncbi:MAG: LuxR C-terminal-related transcriptional regulator [Anaerolineaceae bacterium]